MAIISVAVLAASAISASPDVVEFYAPWCGACAAFKPHWEEVVRSRPLISFATVNCDHPDVACDVDFGVTMYPTVALARTGQMYSGPLTSEAVTAWVDRMFPLGEPASGSASDAFSGDDSPSVKSRVPASVTAADISVGLFQLYPGLGESVSGAVNHTVARSAEVIVLELASKWPVFRRLAASLSSLVADSTKEAIPPQDLAVRCNVRDVDASDVARRLLWHPKAVWRVGFDARVCRSGPHGRRCDVHAAGTVDNCLYRVFVP